MDFYTLLRTLLLICGSYFLIHSYKRKRHKGNIPEFKREVIPPSSFTTRGEGEDEKRAQFAVRREAILAFPLIDPSKLPPPPNERELFKTESRYLHKLQYCNIICLSEIY